MVRFMGNGKRIENVIRCLISSCVVSVYHHRSGLCCVMRSDNKGLYKAIEFMTAQGYGDVFILVVNNREDF